MSFSASIPAQWQPLVAERPVAILGAGESGLALQGLCTRLGIATVLYDRAGVAGATADFTPTEAARHGLVLYSPGFSPQHPWLRLARLEGCLCLGEMDFAAAFWTGPVVAITGTNGKTTLTEFLAFALPRLGIPAVAAGNVGYAFSRLYEVPSKPGLKVVAEVSSFQAETLTHQRLQGLLWTNLDEDHLDRHGTMRDYFAAKWQLFRGLRTAQAAAGDSVFAWAKELGFALPAFTRRATVPAGNPYAIPASSAFYPAPQRENLEVARQWALAAGLDEARLLEAARAFAARPHRIERVGTVGGVACYDDSKGTNFHAALAAIRGFDSPVHWIGGGKNKGGDIARFASQAAPLVASAWLIGETASTLEGPLLAAGRPTQRCATLEEAVAGALAVARPGEVLLLSPGFSSFDMFRNYAHRGQVFAEAVARAAQG